MKYFKFYLLILLCFSIGCSRDRTLDNQYKRSESLYLLGQWYTNDARAPQWLMFDSMSNYYRWNFNEEMPSEPIAKYLLRDSIINFRYIDGDSLSFMLDSINPNSFRILPIEGEMAVYKYERNTFIEAQYVDIFIFYPTKEEVDSLYHSGDKTIIARYENARKDIDAIHLELEYSLANTAFISSKTVQTRDSSVVYNKFDYGGFGIIYYRNDSTYVRSGIPSVELFLEEANLFFPISIESI